MNLYNQRMNAGKAKGRPNNIFDLNEGKDLILTLTKDSNNKTVIQVTDDDERTPLSEDYEKAKAWIDNEKKWNEVYVAKPYSYTSIIVSGGIPVWDKATQGWVEKSERDAANKEAEIKEMQENLTQQTNDFSKFVDEEIKFSV
jgi:hypothetical protein